MFLTNNISESINHILNKNFKYRYPTFNDWKNTIIDVSNSFFNKNNPIQRKDFVTKIIIYFFKYIQHNKKEIKLIKYEEIKKINSIIIPEHDSLSISPLSELLNINDIDSDVFSSQEEDNDNTSLKESDDNSNSSDIEEEVECAIGDFLSLNQSDNKDFNDFRITFHNSINNINYSDFENVVNDYLKNKTYKGKK